MGDTPSDKKGSPLGNKKIRRKGLDQSLLRSVANEILSKTEVPGQPVEEEEEEQPGYDPALTLLTEGELPPEPPPLPEEETPPPLPDELELPPPLPEEQEKAEKEEKADTEAPPAEQKPSLFKKKQPIGEILIKHGVITRADLDYALKYQADHARDKKIGALLAQLNLISNDKYGLLVKALMGQLQSGNSDLTEVGQFINFSLSDRLKLSRLEKELFFPLRIIEDRGMRTLEVYIENDADLFKLDELAAIFNVGKVRPVGNFDKSLLKHLISEIQKTKAAEIQPESGDRITVLTVPDEENVDSDAIKRGKEDNYISRIVDKIIYDGVKLGASDIHVEYGEVPRVRYRVDGLLQEGGWISTEDYPAVVSRFKIMSELDISERRVPQDGNIRLGIEGHGVMDFRVSTLPASGNEKIVLRILDSNKLHDLSLDMIGLPEPILESYIDKITRPQGMVLITGPTGSGKSTTLYSSLIYLLETRGKEMNISTAEDPIEYKLEGLNQSQLSEKVGLTFPRILKALLRQDPDIILVGEIRDLETAGLAIKASQTGHLVLSTLHTNTSVATIARLVNMGIEPFMVADTLLAVMNQRLARRICSNCVEEYTPNKKLMAMIPAHERSGYTFTHGTGCDRCNQRGYKGRLGFYEYLNVNRVLRRMIIERATEEEMLLQAREDGFMTLREYGLSKVKEGLTTMDEVMHHTVDPFE